MITFADTISICELDGHKWVELSKSEPKTYLYETIEMCSVCTRKVKHSRYKYMILEDEYF